MVKKYSLDGVDIDWEHPRYGGCLYGGAKDTSDYAETCEGSPTDWMDYCQKPRSWTFHNYQDIAAYTQFGADLRSVMGYNTHLSMTIGIGEQMSSVWCEANYKDRYNFNDMCKSFNFLQVSSNSSLLLILYLSAYDIRLHGTLECSCHNITSRRFWL